MTLIDEKNSNECKRDRMKLALEMETPLMNFNEHALQTFDKNHNFLLDFFSFHEMVFYRSKKK